MLVIKKKQPKFTRVHYWWVDDLIDHIDFGRHSYKETEVQQMRADGDEFIDDRVVRVYWRCGIVSTVPSGVTRDKDDPQFIAGLYREQIKRREAKEIATAALNDALTDSAKANIAEVVGTVFSNIQSQLGNVNHLNLSISGTRLDYNSTVA